MSSNVVPIASARLDDGAIAVINRIGAALTPEELIAMNAQSTAEQESAANVASAWLKANDLQ